MTTLEEKKPASNYTKDAVEVQPPAEVDGGINAWMTVFGAWLVLFSTFGYVYSFGVYQDYYTRIFLSNHSPGKIGWIGSFQMMMPFAFGIVSGKLFDAGYFREVETLGSGFFVVSLFLLSLAKPQKYFQVFLSQGVGMGIGLGLTFVPTVSLTVHHFRRRKVLATGIVMSGSSLGAVIFPIMINNLIGKIGFPQAVRASAFIVLGTLVIGNSVMRTAYNNIPTDRPQLDIKSFFLDLPYMFAVFGSLVATFGFYFPLIYLQLYAVQHGINTTLAFYSLAILNASSTVGRLSGNFLAQIYGPFNVLVPCTLITAVTIFSVFGVHDSASLIVVSIFHGLFAGAWLSVSVACLATLARHPNEVGARTGVALALTSFASLGAAPVQGALLTSNFEWNKPIIFSGALMIAAWIISVITRTLLVRERGTQKV